MNIVNSIIAMKLPELPSKLKADSSIQSSIGDLLKAQRNAVPSGLSDGFYLRGILGKIRPQVRIRQSKQRWGSVLGWIREHLLQVDWITNGDAVVQQHALIIVDCRTAELDIFIHQELLEELRHSIAGTYLEDENLVRHGKLKDGGAWSLLVWKFLLAGVPRRVCELAVESNNLDRSFVEVPILDAIDPPLHAQCTVGESDVEGHAMFVVQVPPGIGYPDRHWSGREQEGLARFSVLVESCGRENGDV